MVAPKVVVELVARFKENEDVYRRDYGETETRREFIDPFFRALGWDIDNTAGRAEAYKDVGPLLFTISRTGVFAKLI